MDKLTAIRTFVNVVQAGSFSKAAQDMSLSSTRSSRLVKELEDQIGVLLLQRSTRSMSLTEAGEALFQHYTQMLSELDATEAEASKAAVNATGRLRISLPHTFGTRLMGPILRDYRIRHPFVSLDVSLTDSRADLIRDGVDVALRISRELEPAVIARRLTSVRVMLCASPAYLAKFGSPRSPADLASHTCLLYSGNTPPDEWHLNGPEGLLMQRVNGSVRADNGEILRECALGGDGIIMQPTFLIGEDVRCGRLVQVLGDYPPAARSAYAVYANRKHLPRKVRTFIDFLAERFEDPPWWDEGLLAG